MDNNKYGVQKKDLAGTNMSKFKSKENKKGKEAHNLNQILMRNMKPTQAELQEIQNLKFKTLLGHKAASREIAYSEPHKILVSVGFDF